MLPCNMYACEGQEHSAMDEWQEKGGTIAAHDLVRKRARWPHARMYMYVYMDTCMYMHMYMYMYMHMYIMI